MVQWLKDRFEITKLTLQNPLPGALLAILALLQIGQFALFLMPTENNASYLSRVSSLIPWYGWVIGWLALFWFASISYSAGRKEIFDQTSRSFFKAYLENLIQRG